MMGLMAGLPAAALGAQEAETPPAASAQAEAPEAPGQAPSTRSSGRVFLGADGKPLPPEVARQLEERFKDSLPPVDAPDEGETQSTVRFQTLDGKPLPPEVQRRLEEQLKGMLPPDGAASTAEGEATTGDIVVAGQRPRGSVNSDIPPERTFNQLDIRAFGADNIAALLDTIGPQTASNRGRADGSPVTLLNGRRVSDFAEIARIPTEAIERMEIFPEELALQYGFRADQKVVNIVTFPRFQSRVGQLASLVPTDGGRDSGTANADYLRLAGDTRISLGATYSKADALLESERNVQQFADAPDLGRSRTLLPENERFGINGVLGGHVLKNVAGSVNGHIDVTRNVSLLGIGDGGRALRRDSDQTLVHLGTTMAGSSGRWQWTALGNFDHTEAEVLTDTAGLNAPRDVARSTDTRITADMIASGPVAKLPAGSASVSMRLGAEFRDFTSRATFAANEVSADLSRDRGAAQADITIPLLARAEGKPAPLGNLALNANAAVEQLSDAGTLWSYGYGLTWAPVKGLDLIASVTREEGAPTLEQLGGPVLITPNVRTFDFARREVVDLARVSGGNGGLRNDDRHVFRLGMNLRPLANTDFNLSLDYVRTRIDDPIAPFPIVTSQLEAALPDRFTRDAEGRLLQIDARPINFAAARQQQLRWGINLTRPLGQIPEFMRGGSVRVVTSEAEARRLFPNAQFVQAGAAPGAGNLTSRLYVSVYHNWFLEDEIRPDAGAPALDFLDGGAVDFLGGRRRHEVEFQAGAFKKGLGARVSANWRSATSIRDLGAATAGDLRFDDIAVVNLNLFANLSEAFGGQGAPRWLRGTRASIGISNLFNTRPAVRDGAGGTPLSYQPAYLDPLGRVLSFSLRKVL
jgi:hypothetical protein